MVIAVDVEDLLALYTEDAALVNICDAYSIVLSYPESTHSVRPANIRQYTVELELSGVSHLCPGRRHRIPSPLLPLWREDE
jgi:hypothetical protein